jgi:hypothetical protein
MKKWIVIAVFAAGLLVLAACSAAGTTEPAGPTTTELDPEDQSSSAVAVTATAPQEPTPEEEAPATSCPESTADTQLLTDAAHGYCLLYPAEYKVERPNENEVALVFGGLLSAGDPRVYINVQDAAGRSVAEVADQIAVDYSIPGEERTPTATTVAGVEAFVIDKLPGQDMNRRVVFIHNGQLFDLTFLPADETLGEVFSRMETLYQTVLDSFTFMSEAEMAAAESGNDCLEPKADSQLLVNEDHGYCLLYPSAYGVERPNENETVLVVDSLLNVADPRVYIEVEDAAGRTAAQAADEIVASFPEDFAIERVGGVTVGYEPAEQLENVPGQDMSRVVLVQHGDRLIKISFVPADPALGEIYERMESLYTMVINSFRFLP